MSEHVHGGDHRADLGHRVFIASYFVPLAIGATVTIVGFGVTGSVWVALLGLGIFCLLTFFVNHLYTGNRRYEQIAWITGAVSLVIGLIFMLFAGTSPVAGAIGGLFLMPALFAAMVALGPVRIFLRIQRGEHVESLLEEEAEESLLMHDANADAVAVRDDAKEAMASYSRVLRLIGGLLIACAGVAVVLTGLSLSAGGLNLILAIAGLLAIPHALVLFSLANSWYYLSCTKGPEKTHLANAIQDTKVLLNCAIGSTIVLGLFTILELALR